MSCMTNPSSPRHLSGYFFSAPSSPTRVAEFYRDFDDSSSKSRFLPFEWEEKPGTPKSPKNKIDNDSDLEEDDDVDFAFHVGEPTENTPLFAEELFDEGKIKPLKPPPRLQSEEFEGLIKRNSPLSSPRSPISQGKSLLRKAFSPRNKQVDVDPFEAAIEKVRNEPRRRRGRERVHNGSGQRATRSLSPFRVSAYPWEEEEEVEEEEEEERKKKESSSSSSLSSSSISSLEKKGSMSSTSTSSSSSSSSLSTKSSSTSWRKWRLRDLLMFRSTSEGRAKVKNSIARFPSFFKRNGEEEEAKKRSSFGSREPRGTSSISPHVYHYMAKKAESKDLKKRTFLPYKQIGRFPF